MGRSCNDSIRNRTDCVAMEGILIVGIASELRKEEKKLKEIQRSTEVFSSDRKLSVFKIEEEEE